MTLYNALKNLARRLLGSGTLRHLEPTLRVMAGAFYWGRRYRCPCCDSQLRQFVSSGEVCPRCGAGDRQRFQWVYLEQGYDFFRSSARVLDIAPMAWFQRYCRRRTALQYLSIDLDSPLAMQKGNISALPFADGSFEAILCSHVLEHVSDDIAAMRELRRVLAAGGFLIVQVPISGDTTDEDMTVTDPSQRLARFGQKDHVRSYGMDIAQRLEQNGFAVKVVSAGDWLSESQLDLFQIPSSEIMFDCARSES